MEYFLFAAYLITFAWLVTKVKFFTRAGLSQSQLIILYLVKVMTGIFYGWIGIYYGGLAQMWDTWSYHTNSVQEYQLLFNNTNEYLTNLFHDPYGDGLSKLYWNDLKGNVFIKILSIFNILSFGNYYINIIFYSFLTMYGPLAIFRVMNDVLPGRRIPILLATFLIPSSLYWTSGLHKDGLIFTGICLVVYAIYFGVKEKKWGFRRIASLVIGLMLMAILRNFTLVLITPAILAWILSVRKPKYSLAIFAGCYVVFIILFFTARYWNEKLDFPQAVVNKQQEFINLKGGNSTIPIKELQPNAISFLENTPQAITLSSIRPYPNDVRHILSLAAAIEINALLLLFILFIVFHRNGVESRNFLHFCLFFSFTVLLAIGYSVNNLGAIVRYRSIVLPLLVIPMVALTDWKRISRLFFNNIKKNNNVSVSEQNT